jgi:hypothetical protein
MLFIGLLHRLRPGGSLLFLSSTEVYNGITKKFVTEDDIGNNPAMRSCNRNNS